MSRSISDIYDSIIAEKNNLSQLSGLTPNTDSVSNLLNDINNASKVAIWRIQAWVIAVGIWTHEKLWDKHKQELQDIVDGSEPPTVEWYRREIFKFQYDTNANAAIPLQIINGRPQYSSIDPALQIIARCSIVETGQATALIKVVKNDNGLKALTNNEMQALESYIDDKAAMGTLYTLVSQNADKLQVTGTVYYNPQVAPSVIQNDVEAAIDHYLAEELAFNGDVFYQKVVDAMQQVNGVVDVTITSMQAKGSGGTYSSFGRKYATNAGWIVTDNLSNTISYVASV